MLLPRDRVSCNEKKPHGHWNRNQTKQHIHFLELQAVFNGLKVFARDLDNANILLRMNNTTALAYINRMRSVKFKQLGNLAQNTWKCCERGIYYYLYFDIRRKQFFILILFQETTDTRKNEIDSRAFIRKALIKQRLPEDIMNTFLKSISNESLKQYSSTYKKQCAFCVLNNCSVFEANPPEVLKFLQTQFQESSNNYGSFNTYTSAMSLIWPHIGNNELNVF